MEQQIRFCTTSDGVRIAYASIGQGPPLVRVLGWFTHLELEWQIFRRGAIERLAHNHQYVRFDGRGMGLSDREVSDFSLEAHARDLEAVVDALRLRRFSLIALSQGGPTAIRYAVRNPKRVSRLVLYGSFARSPSSTAMSQAMLTMVREGWDHDEYRQFWVNLFMPEADPPLASLFNEFQRASTPAKNATAIIDEILSRTDVRDLLPELKVPTLIIHRRGDAIVPFECGRELAALIPEARFVPLEGRNHAFLPGEPEAEQYLQAIEDFLAEERSTPKPKLEKAVPRSALVTVLFTDLVGHTEMMSRLGDERGRAVLREHERITREVLKAHAGTEVKTMGDGFMASFGSVTRAVECAVALQRAMEGLTHDPSPQTPPHPAPPTREGRSVEPLKIRCGLNAGEPIEEEGDLFGATVILASRIAAKAEGGEILVADTVRGLCSGKGFLFADRGEFVAKGFEEPVRLYDVRWRDA